jgi:NDP-sugar pyrophosphorylase family protein
LPAAPSDATAPTPAPEAAGEAREAPPEPWVVRYEKGAGKTDPAFDHIDYGATAVRRSVVEAVPAGEPAAFDAIQRDLAARKRLRGCLAHERFFEIGSPEGLAELDRHLQKRASS